MTDLPPLPDAPKPPKKELSTEEKVEALIASLNALSEELDTWKGILASHSHDAQGTPVYPVTKL